MFKIKKKGEYMKYNINELAEKYAEFLQSNKLNISTPNIPTFNVDAYNEYEYLAVINELNKNFNSFDDIHITENFLKGD